MTVHEERQIDPSVPRFGSLARSSLDSVSRNQHADIPSVPSVLPHRDCREAAGQAPFSWNDEHVVTSAYTASLLLPDTDYRGDERLVRAQTPTN